MYKLAEQFNSANEAGVESFASVANAAFAGAERLAALNLNAVRTLLQDSAAGTRALLAVKDVQGMISTPGTLARPSLQKAITYSRSVYKIAAETQEALSHAVEGQVSELARNANLSVDNAVKSVPAGSDAPVKFVKSAFSVANSTYHDMNEAVRQITEMAEANLEAATGVKPRRTAA